ncbi:MAG: hypothetical protein CL904_04280 [Dehalococcoidia bacterium]|nr:hypothetical protein [Dehalococcoidia bacterium]MQG15919.1 hypothetical protein [SAR202 cluster bacterium]|tara:strand:+ start:456 stop:2075 length:1620 start_codon:yes stop_codon:yes gene_type:complete
MKYWFIFLAVVFMACNSAEQGYQAERSNNVDVIDTVAAESEVVEVVTEGIAEDQNTESEESIPENQLSIESIELVEEQQKTDSVTDMEFESKPVNSETEGIAEDQNIDLEDSDNNNQPVQEPNSMDEEQQGTENPKSLPDITYFATNKSDRFFVDFEDIVAGHPFVGARSPRPHNDAQVYFSSSDPRWRDAKDPSDFPAIYAVADGYINMSALWFYNVVDHSNSEPPWWHVAYGFTLRVATDDGKFIEFMYQMEPYMIPELVGKTKDFYKQFIVVDDGQFVRKGDILGYMYVPSFDEMVGSKFGSPHIAFSFIKQPSTVYAPAIFTEDVVRKFGDIYRNPTEGWESKSFGYDWNRARGLPDAMGWMISGEENPFNDNDVDVFLYDGIKDQEIDASAMVYPADLGFEEEKILYSKFGWGDAVLDDINIQEDWQLLFAGIGGPMIFSIQVSENGEVRESQVFELRPGQNFSLNHKNNFLGDTQDFKVSISDPEGWGWSVAFANRESHFVVPGTTRDISPLCPPGCPPSPNPYKLKSSDGNN